MASDILKKEMIGRRLKVVESKNKDLVGIEGTIIDETKNTFVIEAEHKNKVLLKDQIIFTIEDGGKKVKIDGNKICFRSEDRIKKIR